MQEVLHAFQQGAQTEAALTRAAGRAITGKELLEFIAGRVEAPHD